MIFDSANIQKGMRNVEIKARVHNLSDLLEKAEILASCVPEIIKQNDVFFKVSKGRLKLRKFEVTNKTFFYLC